MPMTVDQLHQQKASLRVYQERFDNLLRQCGLRAPEPVLGQSAQEYRRDPLVMMKKRMLPSNHELRAVQIRALRDDALDALEPQLMQACRTEVFNPANVPDGEMRRVESFDEYGQVKQVLFLGKESFVKEMGRPGRRVVSFMFDRAALRR